MNPQIYLIFGTVGLLITIGGWILSIGSSRQKLIDHGEAIKAIQDAHTALEIQIARKADKEAIEQIRQLMDAGIDRLSASINLRINDIIGFLGKKP